MRMQLRFYECEHENEMEDYAEDICQSGGEILDKRLDYEIGECLITFDVKDKEKFNKKFEKTNSADFYF